MLKRLLYVFFRKLRGKPTTGNDFSDFMVYATPEEKIRILKKAVRRANEDQKKVLRQFDKMYPGGLESVRK